MKAYKPRITQHRFYTDDAEDVYYKCSGLDYYGLGETPQEAFEDWEGFLHLSMFHSASIFWWVNKQCTEFSKMWRGKL